MIKDHALSEKLIQNAQEATKVIHQSLFWVMDSRPQEEFVKYRLAVAHTFSAIFDNISAPLSAEHPDLDPLKKIEKEEIQSREDNVPAYDKDAPHAGAVVPHPQ